MDSEYPAGFHGEIAKVNGCREISQFPRSLDSLDAEIAAQLQILRLKQQKAAAGFFPDTGLHRDIPIPKTGTPLAIQSIVPKKPSKNRRHKERKPVSFCRFMVICHGAGRRIYGCPDSMRKGGMSKVENR
jgi:hypothetical protein